MKTETIQVRYDAEKYAALRVALELKGTSVETVLLDTVDALFDKSVHKAVQEFLALKSCTEARVRPRPAKRKTPAPAE